MAYKKCPRCEINFIPEDKDMCDTCKLQLNILTHKTGSQRKKTETDFSHIRRGHLYGTNSRTIYQKFCETLNWDKNKINQFGWQTPLYATNADTDRVADVWFIFYPNYDPQKLDAVVDDYHVVNLIQNDGDQIIEVVDDTLGKSNNADRITFVKTKNGYEFFGVYKIIKNGTTRIYKRISDVYPIH